jgi:hypothetical protein
MSTRSREGQRWGGRLTSRPLPDDPIDLDEPSRMAIARSWLGRAAAEQRAADIFALIETSLAAVSEQQQLIDLAHRAIDDELRHAEICRVVASRYAGRELPFTALPLDAPKHRGASDELRHSLWIVGQCAFNETTASAFLEASLQKATAPLAHAAVRELLSDEIDHARIGWAHLTSMSEARYREVLRWIPRLLDANRREWAKAAGADDERFAAHGWITRSAIDSAVEAAEREVIAPGLAEIAKLR